MTARQRVWGALMLLLTLFNLALAMYWSSLASPVNAQQTKQPPAGEQTTAAKGWKAGVGWGWIWGKEDEIGALNAITPESVRGALSLAKEGKTYDLGVAYNRLSYKWPGHCPCEVMTFRSPEGVKRQRDQAFALPEVNSSGQAWHSCAVFISDNVGTQIDGLGHVTAGIDNHWYNGYTEKDWGGDFGIRKCDASKLPPVIARGVMLDIAALKKVEALEAGYAITREDVDAAMAAQKVELHPGDVLLFRTGTLRYWGAEGADHQKIAAHDSAGITLGTAKYLVQTFGVMMIGSDTSGLEVQPAPEGSDAFVPVHKYLLTEQGVPIGEFHYLEDLARDKVYEFCYMAVTNKIVGTTAGFCMRPLAIR